MSLPWVRFDTGFPNHDKVLELVAARGGREAGFVYACGVAYAGGNETDGVIPFAALPFIHGRKRDADLLIEYGLWKPHPRGWEMVNYLDRNPSAESLQATRAGRSIKGRRANCIRWHGSACGCWQRTPPSP